MHFRSSFRLLVQLWTLFTLNVSTLTYRSRPFSSHVPLSKTATIAPPGPSYYQHTYKDLIKVYEAKNVEFAFPSEYQRRLALESGMYDPDSPIPIDVDVYYPSYRGKPKIFMTIPRFGGGVPYSLAVLTDVQKPNGTEIQAYPSYSWHSSHGKDCNGLTSIYRVSIDPCNRMWVLDSGEIEFVQYCPPQMIVFDLATDKVTHRYQLPQETFKTNVSRFVTPIIDVTDPPPFGKCRKVFVYMADPTGVGFVVYDVAKSNSWRIENKFTYPDPDFGTHIIAGESFELVDGAFAFSVTPLNIGLERMLYFHSLSSDRQYAIPLDVVNDASYWNHGIASSLDKFVLLGRRGVQCAATAMTSQGILLCGFLEPIGIYGWNIRTTYTAHNRILLAENPNTLQFVSGLKVIRNPAGKEEVWMLSNRLQKSFTGTTDFNTINYRIQRCGVEELLLRKPCTS